MTLSGNYEATFLFVATAYDAARSELIGLFHTSAGALVAAEAYLRQSSEFNRTEITECEVDRGYLPGKSPSSVKRYELCVQFIEVT